MTTETQTRSETMRRLPRALRGDSGQLLYRGIRPGSRDGQYTFWAADENYAAQYGGEIIEAELNANANILDLTELIDAAGYISGEAIEAQVVGLASSLGIDTDTEIEAERLWDAAGDDLSAAAELIAEAGYDGWRWLENEGNETYLLIH